MTKSGKGGRSCLGSSAEPGGKGAAGHWAWNQEVFWSCKAHPRRATQSVAPSPGFEAVISNSFGDRIY